MPVPRVYPPAKVRFWERASLPDANGCLLWTGGTGAQGYGRIIANGREVSVHRFAYALAYGAIPTGLVIDHLCRVRHCVNPDHLEPVPHVVNVKRGEVGRNQREKTHCPANHAYDAVNTYIDPRGRRVCRACKREWERRNSRKRP